MALLKRCLHLAVGQVSQVQYSKGYGSLALRLTACKKHSQRHNMYSSWSKQSSAEEIKNGLIFRQLFDNRSFTYTYLLADPETREAVLIDPVLELTQRDISVVKELNLNLKYAMNTHVHADHVTGSGKIKESIPTCKSIISQVSGAQADKYIQHGQVVKFGKYEIECRSTPGHTNGCTTYVLHANKMAFTGDAVLIRGCGRTDFQQGSSDTLYESVHKQIFSLPKDVFLYPAHDYTGQTRTTVGEELQHNRRLTKSKEEFIQIMKNLNLPYPKEIDRALPANLVCGLQDPKSS